MATPAPTAARWPSVASGRGAYESYYLRAVHPTEPRGVWIRYTVSAPIGEQPTGQLWLTLFDRDAPRPWALRMDAGPVSSDGDAWVRMATGRIGPAEAVGDAATPDGRASWSLRHTSAEAPLLHLRRNWMYTARLPRTKLLSLRP